MSRNQGRKWRKLHVRDRVSEYRGLVVSCRVRGTCATDFWHVSIIDSSLNTTSRDEGSLLLAFIPLREPKFSSTFLLSTTEYNLIVKCGLLSATEIIRGSVKLCKRTFPRSFPECTSRKDGPSVVIKPETRCLRGEWVFTAVGTDF